MLGGERCAWCSTQDRTHPNPTSRVTGSHALKTGWICWLTQRLLQQCRLNRLVELAFANYTSAPKPSGATSAAFAWLASRSMYVATAHRLQRATSPSPVDQLATTDCRALGSAHRAHPLHRFPGQAQLAREPVSSPGASGLDGAKSPVVKIPDSNPRARLLPGNREDGLVDDR
jgi:hypothetical protein